MGEEIEGNSCCTYAAMDWDEEADVTLKINENYAQKYDKWREKEELQKRRRSMIRIFVRANVVFVILMTGLSLTAKTIKAHGQIRVNARRNAISPERRDGRHDGLILSKKLFTVGKIKC